MAVDEGLIKHVQLLLDSHADAHDRNANGRTLLEAAAESGFTDVAAELLARAPDLAMVAGVRPSIQLLSVIQCVWGTHWFFGRTTAQERAVCGAIRSDFAETMELLLPHVTDPLAASPRLAVRPVGLSTVDT